LHLARFEGFVPLTLTIRVSINEEVMVWGRNLQRSEIFTIFPKITQYKANFVLISAR